MDKGLNLKVTLYMYSIKFSFFVVMFANMRKQFVSSP